MFLFISKRDVNRLVVVLRMDLGVTGDSLFVGAGKRLLETARKQLVDANHIYFDGVQDDLRLQIDPEENANY